MSEEQERKLLSILIYLRYASSAVLSNCSTIAKELALGFDDSGTPPVNAHYKGRVVTVRSQINPFRSHAKVHLMSPLC